MARDVKERLPLPAGFGGCHLSSTHSTSNTPCDSSTSLGSSFSALPPPASLRLRFLVGCCALATGA